VSRTNGSQETWPGPPRVDSPRGGKEPAISRLPPDRPWAAAGAAPRPAAAASGASRRPVGSAGRPTVTLITGGARSGKSRYALELAAPWRRRVYVAAAEPLDEEMRRRIEHHRGERGPGWTTIEEPVDLAGAIGRLAPETEVVVVDCLTVWLGNLIHRASPAAGSASAAAGDSEADAAIAGAAAPAYGGAAVPDPPLVGPFGEEAPAAASRSVGSGAADLADPRSFPEIASFLSSLDAPPCPLILVTNELGWGIVPDNALARAFRDLAGRVNEEAARRADRVVLMVAGRPLALPGGRGG
jgi:adenosylcobinamide kinase/adenosylcobinamide-phosphate guanylyltransferase